MRETSDVGHSIINPSLSSWNLYQIMKGSHAVANWTYNHLVRYLGSSDCRRLLLINTKIGKIQLILRWYLLRVQSRFSEFCTTSLDTCWWISLYDAAWLMDSIWNQDMVLLHHELEVVYEGRVEQHTATLLALGETTDNESTVRPQSAMARTVGLPAAIAAQVCTAAFQGVICLRHLCTVLSRWSL